MAEKRKLAIVLFVSQLLIYIVSPRSRIDMVFGTSGGNSGNKKVYEYAVRGSFLEDGTS